MTFVDIEFLAALSRLMFKLVTIGIGAMAIITILALGMLLVEKSNGRSKPDQPKRRRPF
ncbi:MULTISPECIES: hypothetical protein [unclassified Bradyrhizobium]|uniref:hypothetical protein n=1 Tax=unclassified Bradyrhizobium TaxID=2631580 RepID=UPI0029169D1B|nr:MULTISPECIES: hypothetical protein [unclassified Bradyrhizobium]